MLTESYTENAKLLYDETFLVWYQLIFPDGAITLGTGHKSSQVLDMMVTYSVTAVAMTVETHC